MNNTRKRQLNIRNKLMAAIAMLLVSSIMMVSTTYAWFTLSTAPEVQGITTTVGANGNLEIALSPLSGSASDISTSVGDATKDWLLKNTTWGNLLDMSNAQYELDKIVLNPSQISLSAGKMDPTTGSLAYPKYGSDGRISNLATGTSIGVKENQGAEGTVSLTEGFQMNKDGYGVRAIGTSSGQTENQRVFNQGLSALRSGTTQAVNLASGSLNANGQALANLMVAHAMVEGASDDNNYVDYVDEITNLVNALDDSLAQIDTALKGALTTVAAAKLTGTALTTMQTSITNSADISALVTSLKTEYGENMGDTATAAFTAMEAAVRVRNGIAADIASAKSALTGIQGNTNVSWTEISTVVTYLMDTEGITIMGKEYDELGDKNELIKLVFENDMKINISLGDGSGIYYDIHSMAGQIKATVEVQIDTSGYSVDLGVVDITTNITTAYGLPPYLSMAQEAVAVLTPAQEDASAGEGTTSTKLDVYYGYILDFVFRTNAAGSNLLLQTEAANRVYDDGSDATMGNGSTLTFTVPEGVDENTVKGMVEGIRVVFYNTQDGTVYGIAKATSIATETETGNLVGTLRLCQYTEAANGLVTVGAAKDSAVLTALDQNVAKTVSVMVSLDGNDITNADMLTDGTVSGTLNLQFASSAELVPMQNTDLKTMVAHDVKVNGQKVATVEAGGSYSMTVTPADVESVSVTMGGEAVTGAYNADTGAIAVNGIDGEVVITITYKAPAKTVNVKVSVDGTETTSTTTDAQAYTYTVADYANKTVVVTVNGATMDNVYADGTVTIPAESITGDIVITVTTN